MLVDGVLILYTSEPNCAQMRAWAAQARKAGVEVFLKPLAQLEVKKKPAISPAIQGSLSTLHPN